MASTPGENGPNRGAKFSQVLARLLDLPSYTWNTESEPFHSVSLLASVETSRS